ncbi:hypothetical protein [Haliangium ochraceum]|uniref:Gingipain domain-containing protein n=1 Tax=Haliangium ochraceum (strain DSM 14365 / JCM 11303 / SMP-2) TaxID=502025 RepID=D0LXR7_HALO1|nr:hypothetical protein [Haliangium ochraceum]ACY14272.1 hypothetical protein Hoch_1723 [Haliangium ochraceum DSM 14365]
MSEITAPSNHPAASGTDHTEGSLPCNGVDGVTGQYLATPSSVEQFAELAVSGRLDEVERLDVQRKLRAQRSADFALAEGLDANQLGDAGWAVVFPFAAAGSEAERAQLALREALSPLLQHRARQVGSSRYREYLGELGYRTGESKQQYLARLGAGPGPVNPDKVPYYLLLVASPEDIPYRIQYQLDVQYAVGRIHFDQMDDYERYARSVVEAETRPPRRRRAAFFAAANQGDRATQLSRAYLAEPLTEICALSGRAAGWEIEHYLGADATRAQLGALYGDAPALLFTASHGVGFPAGHALQRAHQGALLCQDWGGPGSGLAREHYFAGEDIDPGADLRGLITMHFACYGGGTPARDDFGAGARTIAPRDFVAALPQRTLAHPGGGALACVGHIDRAWSSSFLWIDSRAERPSQAHVDVFESTLRGLLGGKRLGYALEYFNTRYAELAADLSARLEDIERYEGERNDRELAQMWCLQNDARNYAVIGDPAVRLGENADPAEHTRPTIELRQDPGEGGRASRQPEPEAPDAGFADASSYGLFSRDKREQPGMLARFADRVAETLGNAIADATTLEVKTYVSRDLQRALAQGGAADESTELRAYTRCALDGDTEVCVPVDGDGSVDQALWQLHVQMVEQAQKHRAALIETALSLIAPRWGE